MPETNNDRSHSRKAAFAVRRPSRRQAEQKNKQYKTFFSFLNVCSCVLMLFGVGLYLVFVPRASGFIESENRELATFPEFTPESYFSGEYTDKLTYYYTDTIPGREQLRGIAGAFTNLFGVHNDGVEIIGNAAKGNTGDFGDNDFADDDEEPAQTSVSVYIPPSTSAPESETSDADTSEPPGTDVPEDTGETEASQENAVPIITTAPESETDAPIETKERTVLADEGEIVNDTVIVTGRGTPEVRGMSMFGGAASVGKYYAGVLNDYKKMVGDKVNVYNMSIPLSSAYYCPSNLKSSFGDQHACIRNIGKNLEGVINIDVYDTLASHTDEYIYFRTDHHWEPLGAYYAAQKFCETAAVPFSTLDQLEKKVKEEKFTGTMYSYSNYLQDFKTYPDTFTYYKPKNEYTTRYYTDSFTTPTPGDLIYEWASGVNMYSMFMGGDKNICEVSTDVHNGRTLVLIKNSFGNALVPFFVGSFEKIYVVDFRYVQIPLKDLFERVGATDILFGMAITSSYYQGHIDAVKEIMK